jgi:4-cresol dehydrogenase (hydroxylating)
MALPPGLSASDFAAALEQFTKVVGREWVFSSEQDVLLYRDAYSPFWNEAEDRVPSAAVAPDSTEQVQQIVRIANQYQIPLWTVSTGKNLGYGAASPALSGSVVLDLKRMNRIIEVNDKTHFAVVEPGVSYFDLYRYIQEHKLRVWIDPADPGWGSVLGNACERGGGRTPMRDHFGAICGLEVVLANGEILRTGMGALPESAVWHQYKYGFGPYLDGIFTQSNYGIITRMGIFLMPAPEAYREGRVSVYKHDDLIPFMEHYAYLLNSDILRGNMMLESPILNYKVFTLGRAVFDMPGDPSVAELERIGQEQNLPYWSALFRFWGAPKVVDAQWEYTKEKFGEIPGATFSDGQYLTFPADIKTEELPADTLAALGIPNLGVFGLLQNTEGHLGFSPIIPMTGEAVFKALKVYGEMYTELGITPTQQFSALPWSYYPRALVFLFGISIHKDVEKNRANRGIFKRMIQVAAENGWGEYRTHVAFMDDVADAYAFNNHALRRFHETIKDAVDPNGILSPGKSGIWPRRLRKVT